MPKVKNWQDWETEEENDRSRKRKPSRPTTSFEDSPEPMDRKRIKTQRRRQDEDSPIGESMPDLSHIYSPLPAPAAGPPPPQPVQAPKRPEPARPMSRGQMGAALAGSRSQAPQTPTELTPGQEVRMAYRRGGPREIYKLIEQGTTVARISVALGMAPEMVQDVYEHQRSIERATAPAGRAVRLFEDGKDFASIAGALNVSEAEARSLYARGHVQRYGASPVRQYRAQDGKAFPTGVFEQPTFQSETNRANPAISQIVAGLRNDLTPHGFTLKTVFEPDAMGGRHVIQVTNREGETVGQPFRLTATPNGVPLVARTGKASGGYRLTESASTGGGGNLQKRLGEAALQMTTNAIKTKLGGGSALSDKDAPGEEWMGDGDFTMPEMPPMSEEDEVRGGGFPMPAVRASRQSQSTNMLDLLDVGAKIDPNNRNAWKQISGGRFMRMTHGGRFREENAQNLIEDQFGDLTYPEALTHYSYQPGQNAYLPGGQGTKEDELTPMVSKGSVYPLESRNFSPGNIKHSMPNNGFDVDYQWGSQTAGIGKQLKRDELSLTREYLQAGPALGVAYDQSPQHILGQRATEPDMAYNARAFVLDRGGIIPEGQMWMDTNFAPWTFGTFQQNPEKHQLRFDPNYSDNEVLGAAGLLGPDGKFKPRVLRAGERVASPNGYQKDLLGNNEAGVIDDYEIVETMDEAGEPVKALRFKGYFGNQPNVVSAMKLEGWKNLAQNKHIRESMGIDADIITNRPSDSVVANISMLNAMPRPDFEDLWREVHGDKPAPKQTSTMQDVEDLAPVWQKLQQKNRSTEIIRGQVMDADTLQNYLDAGIVRDGKYTEVPPLFEGAEKQYKADLIATGFYAPVRVGFVTDVTNLKSGHLSNETLTSVEHNFPGLGNHLRELGWRGRDIYNTLFEMHQLNTKPGFSEHGSPVVDLLGDLTNNSTARAGMQARVAARLAEITPEKLRGVERDQMTTEQQKSMAKFGREAASAGVQSYYEDELGTDSFIFRMGEGKDAKHMVNPGMVERFGYVEEESNERISKLKEEGNFQLSRIWRDVVERGGSAKSFMDKIPERMSGIIRDQEELLSSPGARKKWFGTSDRSISTHVHASDYALPRNSMARAWDDIFNQTGLRRNQANKAYLTKLSRKGQLPFSGLRNPNSDPIAQTGTILNMVTPDMLREAGLDIPMAGHPDVFHPHHVQAQGGDNDSDMSQIYMVLQQMAGELVNSFGLNLTKPDELTARAKRHAAGEYEDARKKMMVSPEQSALNQAGLRMVGDQPELAGENIAAAAWQTKSLSEHSVNRIQIGQSYNMPIRVGVGLTDNPESKRRVSEYGGYMYQNPLDKKNYEPGSPEADMFSFMSSFNAFTGSFRGSKRNEDKTGVYYSYRKKSGFENRGQYGAAGLLSIMKRMTEKRDGTQARMSPEQLAGFLTRSAGDLGKTVDFQSKWNLPAWDKLNTKTMTDDMIGKPQQLALEHFATNDSPLAQMMRGFGVRKAVRGAANLQRKLSEDFQVPNADILKEAEKSPQNRGELRDYVNTLQNEMYNWGNGSGSPQFKKEYKAFNDKYKPPKNNFFFPLEPGTDKKDPGEFYSWPADKRQSFYRDVAGLLQRHVTGYGRDEEGRYRNLDPSVSRNNPLLKGGMADYERIRDLMAVNARERSPNEIEGFTPTMEELDKSRVTGPLVREKYRRKQKQLDGLASLFERFQAEGGEGGIGPEFEGYVSGRKVTTPQEKAMLADAERGHQEAAALRSERDRGKEDPMYFAEGGVLDRPTKLGETGSGRAVVGGEVGREFVVPEHKTQDLGGGLKLFDTDELGKGAPKETTALAKGGIIDYEAYAQAPSSDYKTALQQVAQELTGGSFQGDQKAAEDLLRKKIEQDIGQIMANGPVGGQPGLQASSIPGRATDRMAKALGPNVAAADMTQWNNLLGEYGLSADQRPLGVNPQNMDPAVKLNLRQQGGGAPGDYKAALSGFMQSMNSQLAGKDFSHANYGNIYDATPGWAGAWGGKRPVSTLPAAPPSAQAQANLARIGAGGGGSSSGGGLPPTPGTPAAAAAGAAGAAPPEQVPVTGFTKALTGQYVEQLQTVQRGIRSGQMEMDITQAAGSGMYMQDLPADQRTFAGAAGAIETSYQKELARAQRVIEKFTNQEESRDVRLALKRHDKGTTRLDPDEVDALSTRSEELKEHRAGLAKIGMTQRIPETEYRFAQQIKDVLTSGEFGGIVKEKPLSQEAQDAQAALQNRNYGTGDDYMKSAAQFTVDPGLNAAVQAGSLIKNRTLTEKPEIDARLQAEKNALKMGQLGQAEGERASTARATRAGQAMAFSEPHMAQARDMAEEIKALSADRQALYEQARPLKSGMHIAEAAGDIKGQQYFYDKLQPMVTGLSDLKDQISTLTPHVKENVEQLGYQTTALKEQIKEQKGQYTDLGRREETLRSQAVGMPKEEKAAQLRQADLVGQDRTAAWQDIKASAKELGQKTLEARQLTDMIHEPQGRAITGLGKRPETRGEQAMGELTKGYDTQKLFYQFQNMQQLQFMAFAPMLKMQQAYLGEQSAVGQANYALSGGGMPKSVLGAMASEANMSRAQSSFGRGVDNSIAMGAWRGITGFMGRNEGAGSALGSVAFDATSALTAVMGAKMIGGPAVSALGKLAGGLGGPGGWTAPGGATATSIGSAAMTGGGLIAGGLGVGLGAGIYQATRPEGSASLQEFATVAAYGGAGYTGKKWGGVFNPLNNSILRGIADQSGLAEATGMGNLWDQGAAEKAGQAVGKYTGAVTDPIPVWITKLEEGVAKQLGVSTDQLPFDRTELAQIAQMYGETQGVTKKQIEETPGVATRIAKDIADSITSGVSTNQQASIRQKAVEVSGYAPGTAGATMMSEWVNKGSLYEQQQHLQAASMTQALSDQFDFTPEQRRDMSQKVFDLLGEGVSQSQVSRTMQQRGMSNQYYWSQAAYSSGQPEKAIMDEAEPYMAKYQRASWGIEDRRRHEDQFRELGSQGGGGWSGGRQETELGWQRQKLDLEQKFWDFRRKSQLEDFAMGQKQFDFSIRQQRMAMEFEEKQSRSQSNNYEAQYAINKKIFELQSGWQREDFNKQDARQDIQRSWQVEDQGVNRENFSIQSGWQEEDLKRALRYASSGKERMDIRRQMERNSIMGERKEQEFDRTDARSATQYDWAKEDLDTQRSRFEELNELQRQQMELGRAYWLEQQSMSSEYRDARRAAMEEQIALQTEQNALNVQQFTDQMALDAEQHELETGINEVKYQWGLDDLALARLRSVEDEKILGWQRETAIASAQYAYWQAMGAKAALDAIPSLAGMVVSSGHLAENMERYARTLAGIPSGVPVNAPNSSQAMFPAGTTPIANPNYPANGPVQQPATPNYTPNPSQPADGPMTPAPFSSSNYSSLSDQRSTTPSDTAVLNVLGAILGQLQDGGGTIVLDHEKLKRAGFLHVESFGGVYK